MSIVATMAAVVTGPILGTERKRWTRSSRIGPVDVVVHAAGFRRDRLLVSMSEGDFDDVLAAHLRGGFLASRHALPTILARRWGRIV